MGDGRSLGERDAALLMDMLLAARDARGFIVDLDEQAFFVSRLHQNAVIRSLEVIGEAAGRVSAELRATEPNLPWREMTGLRHRLIHGYADVRMDLVWSVAQQRLRPLIADLERLLERVDRPSG